MSMLDWMQPWFVMLGILALIAAVAFLGYGLLAEWPDYLSCCME